MEYVLCYMMNPKTKGNVGHNFSLRAHSCTLKGCSRTLRGLLAVIRSSTVTGVGALGNVEGGVAACTLFILRWKMLNLSASLTVKGGSKEKQNTSLSLEKIKINEVKQKRAYKANFMKLRITVFFLSVYIQCLIDFWHTVSVSEVF